MKVASCFIIWSTKYYIYILFEQTVLTLNLINCILEKYTNNQFKVIGHMHKKPYTS